MDPDKQPRSTPGQQIKPNLYIAVLFVLLEPSQCQQ